MADLVAHYARMDALDDFLMDYYPGLWDEALAAEEVGVDIEQFLSTRHPEILKEFEEQEEQYEHSD